MAYLSPAELARVALLRPDLLSTLTRHMAEFERQTGHRTYVGAKGGLRSYEVQAQTYADSLAQGFRANPPGTSHHEYGAAYDLIIVGTGKDAAMDKANPLYETLAAIGENLGLRAGQHFRSGKPDPYHFELMESLATARMKWDALARERLRGVSIVGLIGAAAVAFLV